jgi:hypothetical protein
MLLRATKVLSHSSVALWYAFNNLFLYLQGNVLPFMECFDNYVSVNLNLSSKGVEIFV